MKEIFQKNYAIFIVSDATGKTAYNVVRSILVQFRDMGEQFLITHYSFVRNQQKLDKIIKRASENRALIVHTFADEELRHYFNHGMEQHKVMYIDIFEKTVPTFIKFLGIDPAHNMGVQYQLTDDYFKKIEAMEFTIAHDDGQNLFDLDKADIILVGPSRSSKTPLSIYLANEGYKVANIPLVYGIPLPDEVLKVSPKKVIALMVNHEIMLEIRKKRLNYLGEQASSYATSEYIFKELEYCRDLYKKNRQWKSIDVTKKAIEEVAAEIIEKIGGKEEVF